MIQKYAKIVFIMNIILQSRSRSFRRNVVSAFLPSSSSHPTAHHKETSTKPPRLVHNGANLEPPSTFPDWAYEPRDFFGYELVYRSKRSNARVGRIHTPHGVIDTPGYVAVATNGAIKGLDMRDADDAGQQLVFCNSYHLMLQPGPEIIEGKFVSLLLLVYVYLLRLMCVVQSPKKKAWVLWAAMCSRVIAQ